MPKQIFRYGRKQALCFALSVFFVMSVAYIMNTAGSRMALVNTPHIAGVAILLACSLCFGALFFRDVIVSEVGLARSYFGISGRTLRWEDIKEVGCGVVGPRRARDVRVYVLRASKGYWPFLSFMVMENIDQSAELVEIINHEITRRGIAIKGWRNHERVLLDRLPPPREDV